MRRPPPASRWSPVSPSPNGARAVGEADAASTFRAHYNQHRPPRPERPDATARVPRSHPRRPRRRRPLAHYRVRHDRVDKAGGVTLRHLSRLHHIGIGAAYKHQRITLLVANKDIRVLADDGSLIRALTLDPTRDYQPLVTPPGPKPGSRLVNDVRRQVSSMS